MHPGVDELLSRWRADPSPVRAVALCEALARSAPGRRSGTPVTEEKTAAWRALVLEVGHEAGSRYGGDVDVLLALGGLYITAGGLVAEAQSIVVRAARLRPTDARVFRLLGETLLHRGDAQRAARAFERAIQAGKGDTETRALLDRARALEPLQERLGDAAVAQDVARELGVPAHVPTQPPPPASHAVPERAAVPSASGAAARRPSAVRSVGALAGMPRRARARTLVGVGTPVPGASPSPPGARADAAGGMRIDELVGTEEDEKTRVKPPSPVRPAAAAPLVDADPGSGDERDPPTEPADHNGLGLDDPSEDAPATLISSIDTLLMVQAAEEESRAAARSAAGGPEDGRQQALGPFGRPNLISEPTGDSDPTLMRGHVVRRGPGALPAATAQVPVVSPNPSEPVLEVTPVGSLADWDTTGILARPPLPAAVAGARGADFGNPTTLADDIDADEVEVTETLPLKERPRAFAQRGPIARGSVVSITSEAELLEDDPETVSVGPGVVATDVVAAARAAVLGKLPFARTMPALEAQRIPFDEAPPALPRSDAPRPSFDTPSVEVLSRDEVISDNEIEPAGAPGAAPTRPQRTVDSDVVETRELRRDAVLNPREVRRTAETVPELPSPLGKTAPPSLRKPPSLAPGPPMKASELMEEFTKSDSLPIWNRKPTSTSLPVPGSSTALPSAPAPSLETPSPPKKRRVLMILLCGMILGVLGGAGYFEMERRQVIAANTANELVGRVEAIVGAGDVKELASADAALAGARDLARSPRAAAVAIARVRALRVLDDGPASAGPLRDSIAAARAAGGNDGELAAAEVAAALGAGDAAAADAAIKRYDAVADAAGDALYQLAAGAVLEARGDRAAAGRYQQAAAPGFRPAPRRLVRALLLGGKIVEASRLIDAMEPRLAEARVLRSLAHALAGDRLDAAGRPEIAPPADETMAAADIPDLPHPLRSLAWSLSALSRTEARGASSGLAAAIDDADVPAVAAFCGRVALAVGDIEAAAQAADRALARAPDLLEGRLLKGQVALLGGRFDDALREVAGVASPKAAELRLRVTYETETRPATDPGAPTSGDPASPLLRALEAASSERALGAEERALLARDWPWTDPILVDLALAGGDLPRARALLGNWQDPVKHRALASRRARLLRYEGKAAEARAAIAAAVTTPRSLLDRVILEGEDKADRDKALAALGEPRDQAQRWGIAYLRAKKGDAAGARRALARAKTPGRDTRVGLRILAASALVEMRDKRSASALVKELAVEHGKNPDVARLVKLLGVDRTD